MQPKTEELLNYLAWQPEGAGAPSFRSLAQSFELWAYQSGFWRQLRTLERQGFVEAETLQTGGDETAGVSLGPYAAGRFRLTPAGRRRALGGRDPEACWSRAWDGRWRLILFDLPASENTRRTRLLRRFRARGFGLLQNSVWLTPDSLGAGDARTSLGVEAVDVKSLVLLEARPCAGESEAEIVAGSWDFPRINAAYQRHLKVLDERPTTPLSGEASAQAFRRWALAERTAWRHAVALDPLLPEPLLPAVYWGRKSWEKRAEVLRDAGRQVLNFTHHGAT